jgi:cellulose synthase/poly-beta-1,6-N-acetylglucosamine synthase-like glycosyltransferase
MTLILVTAFLFLPYTALILYYRQSWLSIPDYIAPRMLRESDLPFVSIVIAARNEEVHIGHCIRSVIGQTYPEDKYEIIIVNDHSTDRTVEVIHSFQMENIRVIHLADFTGDQPVNSYKKRSIETALRSAKGDLILTTDADCMVPEKWVETMASFYRKKIPVFIAAPVVFSRLPVPAGLLTRFLGIFQSLDFMSLQGITGSSVYKKFHGMCNGANLAYPKEVFYEVNGFEGIDTLASGDDILLMHKIQKLYPTGAMFLKSPDVIVETAPAATMKDFMQQRIRWASKARIYTDTKITSVLLLVYLLNAWMVILGISSFFSAGAFYLFVSALAIKIIAELSFLLPVSRFFRKQPLLWWFIPAQPFHILYTVTAGWLGAFGSYQWKGRTVK